jgi:hypothetical protein
MEEEESAEEEPEFQLGLELPDAAEPGPPQPQEFGVELPDVPAPDVMP